MRQTQTYISEICQWLMRRSVFQIIINWGTIIRTTNAQFACRDSATPFCPACISPTKSALFNGSTGGLSAQCAATKSVAAQRIFHQSDDHLFLKAKLTADLIVVDISVY